MEAKSSHRNLATAQRKSGKGKSFGNELRSFKILSSRLYGRLNWKRKISEYRSLFQDFFFASAVVPNHSTNET